jgi:hypothetical protein
MKPRFAMFYPDQTLIDDGEDVEVTFKVPKTWFDAPRDGMQAVVIHRDDGKLVVHEGRDVYAVLQDGEPMATNDLGPMMRAAHIAKYGLWIPNEEWAQVRVRLQEYRRQHEEDS